MGLKRRYKTAVFLHFIFAVFRSQYIADILPLPHLENKRTPYGNSTSGFDFDFLSSSSCNSARTKQILSELDNHKESYDVM